MTIKDRVKVQLIASGISEISEEEPGYVLGSWSNETTTHVEVTYDGPQHLPEVALHEHTRHVFAALWALTCLPGVEVQRDRYIVRLQAPRD